MQTKHVKWVVATALLVGCVAAIAANPGSTRLAGMEFLAGRDSTPSSSSHVIDYAITFGLPGSSQEGGDVWVDAEDNAYHVGNSVLRPAYLVKVSNDGIVLWNRTWGGTGQDYFYGVWGDNEGNIYTCGGTTSFGAGSYDALIVKWNENGTQIWNVTHGDTSTDLFYSITGDGNGSLYVTGLGRSGSDVILIKWRDDGASASVNWSRWWDGGGYADRGNDLWINDDAIYVVGYSRWSAAFGDDQMVLIKWNTTGHLHYAAAWGDAGYDEGYSIHGDSTGTIYTCGYTESVGANIDDGMLVKWQDTGTALVQVWNRTFGGTPMFENGYSVWVNGSDHVFVLAKTNTPNEDSLAIMTFNGAGTLLSTMKYGTAGFESSSNGRSLTGDSLGRLHVSTTSDPGGLGMSNMVFVRLKFDDSTPPTGPPGETPTNEIPGMLPWMVMLASAASILLVHVSGKRRRTVASA